MKSINYIIILLLIFFLVTCNKSDNQPVANTATDLAFPYQDPTLLGDESHCYGLFPWNQQGTETHAGIDLAARYKDLAADQMRSVPIIAPAAGTGYYIYYTVNGMGNAEINVLLQMNDYWFVTLGFEPQSTDATTNSLQRDNMSVDLTGLDCSSGCYFPGAIAKGDWVGNLVVRNVQSGGYPHIHYGLLYKTPSQTMAEAFANALALVRNEGTGMPPTSGPGSPVMATELVGTPTTFYCPYEYSSAAAKAIMDGMTKLSVTAPCSCVCAYNSTGGNCGVCP